MRFARNMKHNCDCDILKQNNVRSLVSAVLIPVVLVFQFPSTRWVESRAACSFSSSRQQMPFCGVLTHVQTVLRLETRYHLPAGCNLTCDSDNGTKNSMQQRGQTRKARDGLPSWPEMDPTKRKNALYGYTDLSRCSTVGVGTIGAPPSTNTKRWLGLGRLKERQHAVGITRSGQRGVATKTRFKFVCMTLEICHVFMTCYQLSHLAERRPSCAGVQCNLWIVVSQNQPNCLRTARTMYSTPFFFRNRQPVDSFFLF